MFSTLFDFTSHLTTTFINIPVTFSIIWSVAYFFIFFYNFLIFSITIYLTTNIKDFINYKNFSNNNLFTYTTGLDLISFLKTPLLILLLINFSWTSPSVVVWFSHIIFTSFQFKVTYLIIFCFTFVWTFYAISFYYSSQEVFDYTIVTYSFLIWIIFLFYSNNIFTVIFFIEILSTIITLLLITSTFSTTYFYNNLSLTSHNYFHQSTPFSFLQTLMFFFWISLISSLNLFVFVSLFYLKFLSFDWFILDVIFFYVVSMSDLKSLIFSSLVWFNFLFCIFLKCGLVPFFFWKPIFFKGMPLHSLFFYIVFFYFFIFYFFIYFFVIYLNELFYYNIFVNLVLLMSGLILLVFIICESYYIKSFLAMSSILNTLFVFFAMSSYNTVDYMFIL